MRKVNHKYAVWPLLTVALILCSSIPLVFTQEKMNESITEVTIETQEAALKQQVLDQIAVEKARFVEGVVGRWVTLTRDGGAELRSGLMQLSNDKLADAGSANTMEAVDKILFDTEDIGSPNLDLVFNKIPPCRIIDTRFMSGGHLPLLVGVTRSFDSNAADFSGQGGSKTNCGLPGSDVASLVAVVVAVDAQGVGNLRAFEKDTPPPIAAVINYNSSNNLANSVVIPLKQAFGDSLEFSLRAFVSNTDVVVDVVGYFWAPSETPVSCTTLTQSLSIAQNNNWLFSTAACPSGTTLTGGGTNMSGCGTNVWFWQSSPNATNNAWQTRGRNHACGATITVTAFARCCSIPGV